jgi:hypothetical protein
MRGKQQAADRLSGQSPSKRRPEARLLPDNDYFLLTCLGINLIFGDVVDILNFEVFGEVQDSLTLLHI